MNDDGGDGDAADGEATLEGTRVSTGAAGATLAVARVAAGEGT